MKRGGPIKADPEKLRAWQQRSRVELARGRPERKTAIKKRNPKRRQSEFARCYGSRERVRAIKKNPCCNCGRRPSENAHTEGGGAGRKAGWETVADLCGACHRTAKKSLHNLGSAAAFKREHGTDLIARARWLAENLKPETE